jgi:hypothetical protein
MMNNAKRFGFVGLLLSGSIALGATTIVVAQNTEATQTPAKTRSANGGRDPFKKYEPPKVVIKRIAGAVVVPSIQERINMYKAQKQAAMNARMPAPKPTTALLLSEIEVIGITHTPRGYAAIVEASPIKLSYVIYPGEPFYDGQLVAIEGKSLIFRHETVYTDGRRVKNVLTKLLRQPNQVNVMAATPSSSSDAVAAKP